MRVISLLEAYYFQPQQKFDHKSKIMTKELKLKFQSDTKMQKIKKSTNL